MSACRTWISESEFASLDGRNISFNEVSNKSNEALLSGLRSVKLDWAEGGYCESEGGSL